MVGMENNIDRQIKEFISLFDGDVSAAHAALAQYQQAQVQAPSLPSVQAADRDQLNSEEVILLQKVSKHYKLGGQIIKALNEVTLSINKGEFVAISGASGSGKSTLLQMIGCLDKPTSGSVTIEGQETTRLSDNKLSDLRQKSIGFIFQSFYLQPFLRLNDNLSVPAMFTNEKRKDIDSRVEQLLRRVGLFERAGHFPRELSGGQVQRAAIARALVNNPRIILADEPTGNLDSVNSESIIGLFRSIRDVFGTTIVVVTHNVEIAKQADRVIELRDGVIV